MVVVAVWWWRDVAAHYRVARAVTRWLEADHEALAVSQDALKVG